jgi:hypothetical protein
MDNSIVKAMDTMQECFWDIQGSLKTHSYFHKQWHIIISNMKFWQLYINVQPQFMILI